MSVIGIVGLAGSGKDTLCNLLLEHLPNYKRYAYADPLKQFCMRVFNLTHDQCYDPEMKEEEVEFFVEQDHMQKMFNSAFETIARSYATVNGCDFFWKLFLKSISTEYTEKRYLLSCVYEFFGASKILHFKTSPRKLLQLIGTEFFRNEVSKTFWVDLAPVKNIIVSDVRFENELYHIRQCGGLIVKIVDPNLREIQESTHASEALARSRIIDAIVVNNNKNKGLKGLDPYVKDILSKLGK